MTAGSTTSEERTEETLKRYFEIHEAFKEDVMALWTQRLIEAGMDQTIFSRLTSQALLNVAATLAVDIHQSEGAFAKIARACHTQAYNKAPKFK